MQDHPEKLRDPLSRAAPDPSSLPQMAQRAQSFGAKLSASAQALRLLVATRLAEIRKRMSAETPRDEATASAGQLRQGSASTTDRRETAPDSGTPQKPSDQAIGGSGSNLVESAKALRLRAATGLDDLRQRASPPALVPTWRYVSTLRTRLSLTSADIETLSTGSAPGEPEQKPGTLPPTQEAAAIAASLAPLVLQETAPETGPRPEQVPSHAPQPRSREKAEAEPFASASTMSRLRNDVLVRTALERPVLAGAAVVALGAVMAALSSAGSARQPRTATPRPRAEEAPSPVSSKRADNSPTIDERPGRAHPNGSADATGTTRENGSAKTGDEKASSAKTRPRRAAQPASAKGSPSRRRSSKPAGSAKSVTK